MKTTKPKDMACLHRFYQDRGKYFLALSAVFFFPMNEPRALFSEQKLWPFAMAQLGKQTPLDQAMPKPRGEYLVKGKCYAPKGEPTGRSHVEVQMGALKKRIEVFGKRMWARNADHFDRLLGNSWLATEPRPFTEMDLSWGNAFGGERFDYNPLGVGHIPEGFEPAAGESPLPCLELPDQMVANPWSAPEPAGFMPIDLTWPQRVKKAGTHDENWLRNLFPGFAADMDWTIFNTASNDQQIDGYWNGDESYRITGMHPDRQELAGSLPGLKPRAFLGVDHGDGLIFAEQTMALDTVWLFPAEEKGVLVYRANCEVQSWDGREVKELLLAYEYMGGGERKPEDYKASLDRRRTPKTASFWLMRQDDLQPPEGVLEPEGKAPAGPVVNRLADQAGREVAQAEKKTRRAVAQAEEQLKEICAKYKLDPKKYLAHIGDPFAKYTRPKMPPLPPKVGGVKDLPALMAYMSKELPKLRRSASQLKRVAKASTSQAEKEMAQAKGKAFAKLEEICKKYNLDSKKLMERAQSPEAKSIDPAKHLEKLYARLDSAKAGAPNPEAASKVANARVQLESGLKQIRKAQADIKKAESLGKKATGLLKNGSKGAHVLAAPALKKLAERKTDGKSALESLAAGNSLAGRDLTGADLTGANLAGCNLRGVILDSAILLGADLRGSDLRGAVMCRADLSGARLAGAQLAKANLGLAKAVNADFVGANLNQAVLEGADFSGAVLKDAKMRVGLARKVLFKGADLSRATATQANFIESDFSGAKLKGAELTRALFYRAVLDGADFTGAVMPKASFVKARARSAVFDQAELTGVRLALGADFTGASFKKASAARGNWRESRLQGAQFAGAVLDGGDFGRCRLERADFYRASAKKTQFTSCDLSEASMRGINLFQGSLMEALIAHTDLTGSNLFSVNMMGAKWDRPKLDQANVKRTALEQRQG